jgi:transposase
LNKLEHLVSQLSSRHKVNIEMLFTPKFHCELAGEGIEYSWGAAKRLYQRLPLIKKKSFQLFKKSVEECLKKVNIDMCRRFSGKSRGYMQTYQHQYLERIEGRETGTESHENNEKIHKIYRSHRDALTFDESFIVRVMKDCINIKEEQ